MVPLRQCALAFSAVVIAALSSACSTLRGDGLGPDGGLLASDPARLIVVVLDNSSGAMRLEAGSTPRGYDRRGPYAVSDAARATARALERSYELAPLREWPIVPLRVDCLVLRLAPHADRDEVLRRLAQDRRVRLAEPLQKFDTLAAPNAVLSKQTPRPPYNDPYFDLQWGFAALNAARAQQWSQGRNVTVAIIDTGVDIDHPDLAGRIDEVRNFVDDDMRAFRTDRHGTLVAGIIAAVANNRVGIVGISPAARLDVLKACEPLASGQLASRCNSFTLALALSDAIQAHAQIVNLSLSGPADPLLRELVQDGERRGMIFVGAMPPGTDLAGFPVGIPGVIAVQSSEAAWQPAAVVPAPGEDVLSLAPGGHYDFATGSSFAAAHVSGALALLRSAAPQVPGDVLASSLRRSRARMPAHGESVDVCTALQLVQPLDRCASPLHAESGETAPLAQTSSD